MNDGYDHAKAKADFCKWREGVFLERDTGACECGVCRLRRELEELASVDMHAFEIWGYPVIVIPLEDWSGFWKHVHPKESN